MKESAAKVKKYRASGRWMLLVLAVAVALELLRPAIHPPTPTSAVRLVARTATPPRLALDPIRIVPPRPVIAPRLPALL